MLDFKYQFVSAYRYNEFGTDGGPAANSLKPKFHVFSNHLSTQTGFKVPEVEVRLHFTLSIYIVMAYIISFLVFFHAMTFVDFFGRLNIWWLLR